MEYLFVISFCCRDIIELFCTESQVNDLKSNGFLDNLS